MMGLIHPMVAACLMCGMFLALPAWAESGRITFSGAVVVPTCSVPVEATARAGSAPPSRRAFRCGNRSQATSDASTYELWVTHPGDDEITGSPLLQYFAGYLAASHIEDVRMVTRTYE